MRTSDVNIIASSWRYVVVNRRMWYVEVNELRQDHVNELVDVESAIGEVSRYF